MICTMASKTVIMQNPDESMFIATRISKPVKVPHIYRKLSLLEYPDTPFSHIALMSSDVQCNSRETVLSCLPANISLPVNITIGVFHTTGNKAEKELGATPDHHLYVFDHILVVYSR